MSDHTVEGDYEQQRLDLTGHCQDHPQIRVRRPNANGIGWRTILTKGCPLCAVDPVKPLTRRISNGSHALIRRNSNGSSTCRRSMYNEHQEFSSSTSDITATTVASSGSSFSANSNIEENASLFSLSPSSLRLNKQVLFGTRNVDPATREVISNGQVFADSELPNGLGCLRFRDDGKNLDEKWVKTCLLKRDLTEHGITERKNIARHPSSCRRDSLSRSFHLDSDDLQTQRCGQLSRHPSRSRRLSLSGSFRFDDNEDDVNSINCDNNSLGSHGERTVGTYSARESKGSRIPNRSSEPFERRPVRSYMEVKR
ncbi:hypothetical protein ACHAW6_009192 [Cyclotella cf. meneghiniana]